MVKSGQHTMSTGWKMRPSIPWLIWFSNSLLKSWTKQETEVSVCLSEVYEIEVVKRAHFFSIDERVELLLTNAERLLSPVYALRLHGFAPGEYDFFFDALQSDVEAHLAYFVALGKRERGSDDRWELEWSSGVGGYFEVDNVVDEEPWNLLICGWILVHDEFLKYWSTGEK